MDTPLTMKIPAPGIALLFTLAWGVCCSEAVAEELQPYTANYSTSAMGLSLDVTRELTKSGADYTLTSSGSSLLVKLSETAHFAVKDGQVLGKDYTYELKSVVRRRREVHFDPASGVIRALRKDQWTEHPWSADILDTLSQQEQLRLDLKASAARGDPTPTTLEFTLVDGSRIKPEILDFVAVEELATPLGKVTTLRYHQRRESGAKRSSDIWVAPDLDYAMVLTRHREKDTNIEIKLEALNLSP